jgi:hypothetical protein
MTIATSYETLSAGSDDGCLVNKVDTKLGFYGKVPVVIRPYSSAVHASSALSSSADFGATQLAWAQEVTKTLTGLGIWATV